MIIFPQDTIPFLRELRENNNRPWFQQNKTRYDAIQNVLVEFCDAVIQELSKADPTVRTCDARRCVYRIYRDVRFSNDKRPYKEHVSFWIPCGGNNKVDAPGYYFQIEPEDAAVSGDLSFGSSCLGGGVFSMYPTTPNVLRQEIFYNVETFQKILKDRTYRKYFGTELWDPYPCKTIPPTFRKLVGDIPDDFPCREMLKQRSFVSLHRLKDNIIPTEKMLKETLAAFHATIPLNEFFAQAMQQTV